MKTTFSIDKENNITALAEGAAAVDGSLAFASANDLAKVTAEWPIARLVETWNGFAGTPGFDTLKPVKKFENRAKACARIWDAIQRLAAETPAAAPAPAKATKAAKPAKKQPKAAPAAKKAEPKAPRADSKKAEVIKMLQRKNGASNEEIQKATDWQPHYADVRIMPTSVGNPACGAGIAAMESA